MLFFAAAILYSSVHLLGVAGSPVAPAPQAPQVTAVAAVAPAAAVPAAPAASAAPVARADARVSLASDITHRVGGVELSAPVEGVPAAPDAQSASHALSASDTRSAPDDLSDCGAVDGRVSSATATGRVSAPDCLLQLGEARPSVLARFGRSFHDDSSAVTFATALGERGSAVATSVWWKGLDDARRTDLLSDLPAVLGNLEGIPYDTRDLANRITLSTTIARLEGQDEARRSGLFGITDDARRLVMLQQVEIALDRGREGDDSRRSLLSLDTVFPGKAAVAVGDVDTADNVTMMVPGMLYTVSNQIAWWTDRAADLHSEQDFWSSTLATAATAKAATNATVAWMGYRTPDLTNVLGLSLAKAGAVHLEDAVQGLTAARAGSEPHVTLISHSYGSTTATIALTSGRIHVDSFVALGSPGSVVARAAKLAVAPGNVFAAAAALDPVAGSGFFGADPGSTLFGATLLDVAGGRDPFTEQSLSAVLTHNRYFTPGSQSMRNLALIGVGRGDLAQGRAPLPEGPRLANQPSLAFVRPQDVYREPLGA